LLLFEQKHTSKAHVELFNTGKSFAVPRMKAYGGIEVYFHTLLNSTPDRCETSKAHVELFNTGKSFAVPRMKAYGGIEEYFHTLLNSTPDRCEQLHTSAAEESDLITD